MNINYLNGTFFVAGARGLVGSSLVAALQAKGVKNILAPASSELDFTNTEKVRGFFQKHRPQYVFLAAAKVGGIVANNTFPVDFILQNLKIQNNIIESAHEFGCEKLLFLGSSCIYPKLAKQPIHESELLNGYLEPTNAPYAVAKIAGITLCQSYHRQYGKQFISVMPTNLYGPNDNYHPTNSHVIPGLIRRLHVAKMENKSEEVIWGTGTPKREFLFSSDLAEACLFLMENYDSPEIINIGSGQEVMIKELAQLVKETVGFAGNLVFDSSKPDGTPRKLVDTGKINQLGWRSKITLAEGLRSAYQDFLRKN